MALNLPDSNKTPGDKNHTSDTNLIIDAINALKSEVDNIPAGPQGAQGDPGTPGAAGTPATVTVGSTNTSAAGGNAAVTNSGTASNAVFDFTIPRGAAGPKGDTGAQGPQGPPGEQGPQGPPGGVTPDLVTLAGQAALSAANAATSESNAAASEAGVDADRVAAQAAAAAALASEQAADASEAAALASEQAADASEVAAAASAAAALASENAADASESAAASSESNAAASESAAGISASAAAGSASAAATSASSISSYASLPVEFRQFGADGSILQNLPTRVHPGEQLLKQAVWWIDSAHSSASGQSVSNLGWGASALDARLGSASGADSNDPKFLDWDGENYVYLPGVVGNSLKFTHPTAASGNVYRITVAVDAESAPLHILSGGGSTANEIGLFATNGVRLGWLDGTSTRVVSATNGLLFPTGANWIRGTVDATTTTASVTFEYAPYGGESVPPVSGWTALLTATQSVTNAGVTINAGNGRTIGARNWTASGVFAAKVYRVIEEIDGTKVLDVDCSQIASGSNTSFTALTGQTVTINRSSSGRKSVAVTHPVWLFGTDDYMEVADNDLLDFGASDSFTVLAVVRNWNNNTDRILQKGAAVQRWVLYRSSGRYATTINDGTNFAQALNPSAPSAGTLTIAAGVNDRSSNNLDLYENSTLEDNDDTSSVGSLSNAESLLVGRYTSTYADMEFIAAALFRKSLSAGEIATLTSYYQGRVS